MKIYFFSALNGMSYLTFTTFVDTFVAQGHTIVSEIENADTVFYDWYSGLGRYDAHVLNYVLEHRLNIIAFDAKDYGAMSKEKFEINDLILVHAEKYKNLIYFMRKMDKTIVYPKWVYPYELILYPDHNFTPTTKEELFNRPNDIFFIGNRSPTRENVCRGLLNFKIDYCFPEERIPHDDWLNAATQSKLFLTADGGGFGDERPYQLITIAPMLKQKNNQLVLNDFEDAVDCIKINEHPTKEDIFNLKALLDEPEILYGIYLNGIEHMKKYYNAEYRANYILDVLKQNDIN